MRILMMLQQQTRGFRALFSIFKVKLPFVSTGVLSLLVIPIFVGLPTVNLIHIKTNHYHRAHSPVRFKHFPPNIASGPTGDLVYVQILGPRKF
ncbi:hypothetical protein MUK42_12307 [Musa troglodytarum]|uniref:Uncharacterized protein n=1 Tax=Musa troglodytarum TaxID=320322 RepID=A0A9E7KPW8_9LILI|nr:hypothetical protein MUK42_12307 [Musa troglodytarum]